MKKKELAQSEAEVAKTREAVAKLQKRLQDAEKLLVRQWDSINYLLYVMPYRRVAYTRPRSY